MYYIYRFLDKYGKVIYIGKTIDLTARINSHFNNGHLDDICYKSTKKIEYITFPTKVEMDMYEIYLINKFKPKFNISKKVEKETFSIEGLEFDWSETTVPIFSPNPRKKKKKEPVGRKCTNADLVKVVELQRKFNNTAKIVLSNIPNFTEELQRIENLMEEAFLRVYNERS